MEIGGNGWEWGQISILDLTRCCCADKNREFRGRLIQFSRDTSAAPHCPLRRFFSQKLPAYWKGRGVLPFFTLLIDTIFLPGCSTFPPVK